MTPSIRPASSDDAERVCQIHLASIRELGASAYDERQVDAWASYPAPDRYTLSDDRRPFVVAEADTGIVGFAQLDLDGAEVDKVYVDPDHVRGGVGSLLLGRIEDMARTDGLDALRVVASENAVSFYEAGGYRRTDELTKTLRGDVPFTCTVMEKTL